MEGLDHWRKQHECFGDRTQRMHACSGWLMNDDLAVLTREWVGCLGFLASCIPVDCDGAFLSDVNPRPNRHSLRPSSYQLDSLVGGSRINQPPVNPARRRPSTTYGQLCMSRQIKPDR